MNRLGAGLQRFGAETGRRFRLRRRVAVGRCFGGNIFAMVNLQRFHLKRSGLLLMVLMLVLRSMKLRGNGLHGPFSKCLLQEVAGFPTLGTGEAFGFESSLAFGRNSDFDRL